MGESQDLLTQEALDEDSDEDDEKTKTNHQTGQDLNGNPNPHPHPPLLAQSGGSLEIRVDLPDHLKKRKRKKAFDFEAHLKRELSKSQRQTQVWMHRAHILCLLAHNR